MIRRITTAQVRTTATDWVRSGDKHIAIPAGPVEQVENNITGINITGIDAQITGIDPHVQNLLLCSPDPI